MQSSWWGRESWLLCFICLRGVSWLLCDSSSRCHGLVCSLWLWYYLIILSFIIVFNFSGSSRHNNCFKSCDQIKGYHLHQVKPPMIDLPISLPVEMEYSNIKYLNACLVWMPKLENLNKNIHDMVTDSKRFLYLNDIAGLPVGNVPWGLSGAFHRLIEKGCTIFTHPAGEPVPSFPLGLMLRIRVGEWGNFEQLYIFRVISGLPGAFYSVCCLGVVTILDFETIEIAWPIQLIK